MKLFVVVLALCLTAYTSAQSDPTAIEEPSADYLPPVGDNEAAQLAEDGYRYKTVRKLKYRQRRDVSQEYLPPVATPSQDYLPPDSAETRVADDGYRYKTVRRLKYRSRHRRDVSEIAPPTTEYLPPVNVELAPELKTELGEDGYRYRTVRRLKYRRHRRDVEAAEEASAADSADAPANEYLPPSAEAGADGGDAAGVKSAELANDGYRYKTIRRLRYRYRH